MTIGVGKEENGVYHLQGIVPACANKTSTLSEAVLWHQRMGHHSNKFLLSLLSKLEDFDDRKLDLSEFCDICIQAKQARDSFVGSNNKAAASFYMIHCDVWGPYSIRFSCGAHYLLTIVDDFSNSIWTHLLLVKTEVATV